MSLTLSGSGTVTGLTAGGLPDATVTSADIVDANVTQAKLAAGVAGNGPAFSAVANAGQTITNGTFTKIAFQVEEFDTANCFDTTNYRFTPTVAGYYQISGHCTFGVGSGSGESLVIIFKNGARFKDGLDIGSTNYGYPVSALVYFNGTTDYVELYVYQTSGVSRDLAGNLYATYFQGALVRAA